MRTTSRGRPLHKRFTPGATASGIASKSELPKPAGDPVGVQLFKQYCIKHYDSTPHFLKRIPEPTDID